MAGVSFPFSLTTTGSVKMDDGTNRKKLLVISAILTRLGERADIPSAGILGHAIIFRNTVSQAVKNVIITTITNVVENQIKGIHLNKINFTTIQNKNGTQTTVIDLDLVDTETNSSTSARVTV